MKWLQANFFFISIYVDNVYLNENEFSLLPVWESYVQTIKCHFIHADSPDLEVRPKKVEKKKTGKDYFDKFFFHFYISLDKSERSNLYNLKFIKFLLFKDLVL